MCVSLVKGNRCEIPKELWKVKSAAELLWNGKTDKGNEVEKRKSCRRYAAGTGFARPCKVQLWYKEARVFEVSCSKLILRNTGNDT